MNYFTSDHHFGHKAIIHMCNRPFSDIDDMNEQLINKWNENITNEDTVYHLGDFSYKFSRGNIKKVLNRLNGKIIIIKGNHDNPKDLKALSYRFESIESLIEIKDPFINRNIVLCHYPLESWHGSHRGIYHIHGHCHQNLKTYPDALRFDAGVEGNNYYPYSSLDVQTKMSNKLLYGKYFSN